jgi:diadenosine tetraphosphate (Ap4A) HIT family hydrolase
MIGVIIPMMRAISEAEYSRIASQAVQPLHPGKNKILYSNATHYVIENRYPYTEYEGMEVLHHFLICDFSLKKSIMEYTSTEIYDREDMIAHLFIEFSKYYDPDTHIFLNFAKHSGKSVEQYHTHFLILRKKS